MSDHSVLRITRELYELTKGGDLSIAAACRDVDVRRVRALIIGPPDTPYEFGFFEFLIKFGKDYPTKAPYVISLTTNRGQTRFNPNIYSIGKVCLSILGTWRGSSGEEWSSAQGLESVLLSIQSLMSSNPYENEPGFEEARGEEDKKLQQLYVEKIRHETLRISVIERLEDHLGIDRKQNKRPTHITPDAEPNPEVDEWEPFKDKCKLRCLWYFQSYMNSINDGMAKHKDGTRFERMPFEGHGNQMDGQFMYSQLKKRLLVVREKLDEETALWAGEGLIAVQKELTIANNIKRQYEQTVELFKRLDSPLDIELIDDNPFVWILTLVGQPMTNLDAGIVRIRMHISPNFPEEQPRVVVLTPLFHHRISSSGQLCYFTTRDSSNLASHVQAIITAIEDENPAYDPRTLVNPEAAKLLWGSPEDKKTYNRRLRRSVQDSLEYGY
ncbi:UBC-like protein [Trichodelitschia bisporula]|uniref:Ubiquitin-conjugating enzyme E2 Z n=1 Tax=Trichodelitschia bisporula TaxID=703511 RepID=A0A6G1HXJ1_9PEZI|nr:UBC-like protein [Trichodelitschia bisporula]